jgi:Na+-transporting methylmalonyl-CoA/oxaloacetate decarboxylase beta subunit
MDYFALVVVHFALVAVQWVAIEIHCEPVVLLPVFIKIFLVLYDRRNGTKGKCNEGK